jgi:hypothetical protein
MILEISLSHMKVRSGHRVVTLPVKVFFPPNDKMGLSILESGIKYWDSPHDSEALTSDEINHVIDGIQREFDEAGHALVVVVE